jgi:hypothetical protein
MLSCARVRVRARARVCEWMAMGARRPCYCALLLRLARVGLAIAPCYCDWRASALLLRLAIAIGARWPCYCALQLRLARVGLAIAPWHCYCALLLHVRVSGWRLARVYLSRLYDSVHLSLPLPFISRLYDSVHLALLLRLELRRLLLVKGGTNHNTGQIMKKYWSKESILARVQVRGSRQDRGA